MCGKYLISITHESLLSMYFFFIEAIYTLHLYTHISTTTYISDPCSQIFGKTFLSVRKATHITYTFLQLFTLQTQC